MKEKEYEGELKCERGRKKGRDGREIVLSFVGHVNPNSKTENVSDLLKPKTFTKM